MNPGFHLSCDENLSKGWGPPLYSHIRLDAKRKALEALEGWRSDQGSSAKIETIQ